VAAGEREASASVEYVPGSPYNLVLTADPLSIPANGVSTTDIGAEVMDRYGNHVADRTTLVFSTDLGSFPTGGSFSTATLGGRAGAVLTSSTTPGIARVAATAGGRRVEIFVDFYFVPTPTPPPTPKWKTHLPIIMKNRLR
jgi:adhesin/invasin